MGPVFAARYYAGAAYSIMRCLCVCLCVCLSVTFVYSVKMSTHILIRFPPCDYVIAKKLELQTYLTSEKLAFCRAWGPYDDTRRGSLTKSYDFLEDRPKLWFFSGGAMFGPP